MPFIKLAPKNPLEEDKYIHTESLTNNMSKKNLKEFDFSPTKEQRPDYLAELVSVIIEDFDKFVISDKSKEEISRRAKEIIDQTREETIREVEKKIYKYSDKLFNDCLVLEQQRKEDTVEYSNKRSELNGYSNIKQSLINLRSK